MVLLRFQDRSAEDIFHFVMQECRTTNATHRQCPPKQLLLRKKKQLLPQLLLQRQIYCDSVVCVASFDPLLPLDGFFIAGCRKIKP
jgi:hypothetical protein